MADATNRSFVIVSGLPGSGKTTLARRLASRLALPLFDKDEILEQLFEAKGTGDTAWRRTLSRESDAHFQTAATESRGAVLASFWHLRGMPADSGTPTSWLSELSAAIVNVRCICPTEVAATRFFRRTRHPGHLDTESSYSEVLASLQALARLGALNIEPAIDVDTSGTFDLDALVRKVQAGLTAAR